MEFIIQLLSHVAVRATENLLVWFSKPSDIRRRLSTVEAYCAYYPLYIVVSRLGKADPGLVERFVKSLNEDPGLLARVILMVGRVGPSRQLASVEVREGFKRNASLLYIPEPYLKDLMSDVSDDINRVLNLIKQDKLEDALRDVEEKFKKKYSEGDLQIPGVEEVVEEALILVLATLKFKEVVDIAIARRVIDYYAILAIERALETLPLALITLIYSIAPPESLPPTIIEFFKKWRLRLDPLIIEILKLRAEELGFSYDDFKNAFLEIERFLR